jgi:hypothetical protein
MSGSQGSGPELVGVSSEIASVFIAAILTVSLASRFARSFELRVTEVTFDHTAQIFIRDTARRTIRFIANEPDSRDRAEYSDKLRQVVRDNDLTDPNDVIFVEVTLTDPSGSAKFGALVSVLISKDSAFLGFLCCDDDRS